MRRHDGLLGALLLGVWTAAACEPQPPPRLTPAHGAWVFWQNRPRRLPLPAGARPPCRRGERAAIRDLPRREPRRLGLPEPSRRSLTGKTNWQVPRRA